jgi:O-antigen biosynthesis protein
VSIYSKSFQKQIFDDPNTSLSKIYNLINNSPKKILDVGCSGGYLGKYIKQKYPLAKVDGIEINQNDFAQASKVLNHVFNIDIQNQDLVTKLPKNYDLIIFADILEHTIHPEKVLANFLNKLSSHGQVIISVPNITHQSVILELLANQWNYESSGILDQTHLQFFDYHRTINLIEKNKLQIKKIDFTIFDIPTITILETLKKYHIVGSKLIANNLKKNQHQVFQYIISATKDQDPRYQSYNRNFKPLRPIKDWINDWEIIMEKYKNSQLVEKELNEIKSSQLYKLWPLYNKISKLINNEKQS